MWVERNGPTWRIRERVGVEKVTLADGYPTKTAAKAAMVQLKADAIRGEALVPRGGRLLLRDWIEVFWPLYEPSLKPNARHSEGGRVRNHILPLLGDLELDEVDPLTVQRWVSRLLEGGPGRRKLAPKTVHNCHGVLHRIMAAAVLQRYIRQNPCADTALPKRVHREMRFLTEPEIGRLVAALPAHWRPLVLLLVSTGLRWGEATGLKAGRVDVLTARLTVLESMTEMANGELIFGPPKSERSRRTVPFPKSVALELAPLVAGKVRDELVFSSPRGGPVRTRNFRRTWTAALKRAGIDGLRVHDLRHTHAAVLISAGVPLTAIQRRLGHSSIAVTSDLYGHLLPQVDDKILAAVDAALTEVPGETLAAEIEAELADL